MELFGNLHNLGNTIVLVTHEEDISLYAHRVVRLHDGQISYDKPQAPRASGNGQGVHQENGELNSVSA